MLFELTESLHQFTLKGGKGFRSLIEKEEGGEVLSLLHFVKSEVEEGHALPSPPFP